jgi:YD repeat-containing protein
MNKIIIILLVALSITMRVQAQYDGSQPSVAPIPPNEAALFKPLAQPVGSFTGTVPTSIPLMTAGKGNLQIPITLNYAGMALKVEEIASSVGLGWSLSAGGSITRAMRGAPDDFPNIGYLYASDKPSNFNNDLGTDSSVFMAEEVLTNQLDLQPDLYYFSCNGLSGKFFFDEHRKVHIQSPTGVSIVPIFLSIPGEGNPIMGWILTDTKGNKYYFGLNKAQTIRIVDAVDLDFSSENGYTTLPPDCYYYITWYLMEMDDMNQENIVRFTYDSSAASFETRAGGYAPLGATVTYACKPSDYYSDDVLSIEATYERYVKTIVTPIDSTVLYNDTGRIDYLGGLRVDSIKQYDLSHNIEHSYHFNYGYFNNGSGTGSYRLYLRSLSDCGNGGTDSLGYTFSYYTGYNLPNYMSAAQDYWGYYNGMDNNTTLIPNGTYNLIGTPVTEFALGDRRAYFPAAMANMLTKITYPSGGYRQFTYENNTALYESVSQVNPDPAYFQTKTLSATTWTTFPTTAPQYQAYFDVNSTNGSVAWNYNIVWAGVYGSYTVTILDSITQRTLFTFTSTSNKTVSLVNGHYLVEFTFNTASSTCTSFTATWNQLQLPSSFIDVYGRAYYTANMNVGGVRVQQINDYDPVTGQTLNTQFKYKLYNYDVDTALTSGLLISIPIIASQGTCTAAIDSCFFYRLWSSSNYPLNSSGSSYVVYPQVRTIQTGNGYTDQYFSFQFDDLSMTPFLTYPYVAPDLSYTRGKLISQRRYDTLGNLLEEDSTNYYGINDPNWGAQLIDSSLAFKIADWVDANGYINAGCWTPYYLTSEFTGPTHSYTISKATNGSLTIRTDYTYYLNPNQPFLKQTNEYFNNGVNLYTNYRYSFSPSTDFIFGLTPTDIALYDTLFNRNYLGTVEVSSQKVSSTQTHLIKGFHNSYAAFNGNRYHLSMQKTYASSSDSLIMNYVQYDSSGNFTEQYLNGGAHTVFLWGYNHNLPIAKITGSTYATCLGYVFYPNIQTPSSDSVLRAEVNKIRTALSGSQAQVTTYTYAPLLGMTSITDPTNTTTYFQYDDHGRLMTTLDLNSNLIRMYLYHLTNP